MCFKINKIDKQEVGIWWVQKCFPQYGVPIWSLWQNIRPLPSIVAEKNATKNEHICSMCIKTKQSRQTGSRNLTGPKTLPTIWYTYGIWSLWPKIRFLPSTVTEKNAPKNILDGQSGERGYKNIIYNIKLEERCCFNCSNLIEDETHFILHCPVYSDFRNNLLLKL